ncbi:hypothetical protein niasHT_037336 [Heterodera trifolii]|uniref:Uncharacterized protein n=1 Tax=Heterodera trifolii TaxID=157864 RepID=A0ABD2J4T3_9BILA
MSRPYIVLNAACPTAGMNMCYGIACFSLADGKQNLFVLDCMHAKDMKSFCKKREDELKKVATLSNLKCVCRFGNEGEQNANRNFDQEFMKITIVPATQNFNKTTIVPATQNFNKTTVVPATQVPNTELPFNPFVQYDCADYNTCAGTVNSVSIFVICAIVILIII